MLQTVIPVIRIFDVQKAKEFYIDWLEFTLQWEHTFDENFPVYMEVAKDNVKFHLTEHYGDCTPGSKTFIFCNSINEYCEKLKAKNYKYYKPAVKKTFYNTLCMDCDRSFRQSLII